MSYLDFKHKASNSILIMLVVLLFMNSFGFIILFVPGKLIIKTIVHRAILNDRIDDKKLNDISINIQDLKSNEIDFTWEEKGREFRLNGKIYDVKKIKKEGDSIHITCYYDSEENILEHLFTLFFSKSNVDKHRINLFNLSFGAYYTEQTITTLILSNRNFTFIPLIEKEELLMTSLLDVPTPPPQHNKF